MTLINSISGIRGTIGGLPGKGLTPVDLTSFTAAYGTWLIQQNTKKRLKVVIGRDARISGEMVCGIVCNTLNALGIDTIEAGMAATPTVEMAVGFEQANGGIIISASHNPAHWNALKLLNQKGEFLSREERERILSLKEKGDFHFVPFDELGISIGKPDYHLEHISRILDLQLVKPEVIRQAGFRVVIDGVNSVGGFVVPALLSALGVQDIVEINCEPTGIFKHNPEPLPEHLQELADTVVNSKADIGIVVDPDVDRLAFVCENGDMFGEEYTLVAVADYVLKNMAGNTVSNLSSTEALSVITGKYGGERFISAVGEINVVKKMKEIQAVIGGEGNGGIIYPPLHYGRDALVGIALFLSYLAEEKIKISQLRKRYPDYFISKNKMVCSENVDTESVINRVKEHFRDHPQNTTDGLFIKMPYGWIHLRRSNTEPVFRIYAESTTPQKSRERAEHMMNILSKYIKKN